jgi:hypothetical protein
MKANDSLKSIERRAYRATFKDGIYDITFGLAFLILAWIPVLESLGISRFIGYFLFLIPILIPWPAKRFITLPRLGLVEFGPKRKARKHVLLWILAVVILATLPLYVMMVAKGASDGQTWLLTAALILPIAAIAVFIMDFPRIYLYAAVLAMGIVESEFLIAYVGTPLNAILSFGLPGILILILGLSLLVRFLTDYPRPVPEANHAG